MAYNGNYIVYVDESGDHGNDKVYRIKYFP